MLAVGLGLDEPEWILPESERTGHPERERDYEQMSPDWESEGEPEPESEYEPDSDGDDGDDDMGGMFGFF